MIGTSLLDTLAASRGASDGERAARAARLATAYVASALADWQRVLDCEEELSTTTFADSTEEAAVNRSLYETYQKWSAEATKVLEQTRKLAAAGQSIAQAEELEQAYARMQARLKLTPDMFERAMAQSRRGEGIPMKELRDELRARVRT